MIISLYLENPVYLYYATSYLLTAFNGGAFSSAKDMKKILDRARTDEVDDDLAPQGHQWAKRKTTLKISVTVQGINELASTSASRAWLWNSCWCFSPGISREKREEEGGGGGVRWLHGFCLLQIEFYSPAKVMPCRFLWVLSLLPQQSRKLGFDPWVGKIQGRRECYLLQYSCLENPMDRGPCVHGVTKSWTRLND